MPPSTSKHARPLPTLKPRRVRGGRRPLQQGKPRVRRLGSPSLDSRSAVPPRNQQLSSDVLPRNYYVQFHVDFAIFCSPPLLHTGSEPDRPAPPGSHRGARPRIHSTRPHPDYCPSARESSGSSPPFPAAVEFFLARFAHARTGRLHQDSLPLFPMPGGLFRTGGRGRRRIEGDMRVSEPWQGKGWLQLGLKAVHARVFVSRLP